MASQGNLFSRDYSTGDSYESSLFPNPIPEEKGKEHLYSVDNEVVNDLRRFTRAYAKKIGGQLFLFYPKENIGRKTALYWKTQCWLKILKNW